MSLSIPTGLNQLLQTESGQRWFSDLPQIVSALCDKWNLVLGEPYNSSTVSYTVPATQLESEVVLKIQWPHDECVFEADALQVWNGHGAVKLLECDRDRSALLLERCNPGINLGNADIEDKLKPLILILEKLFMPTSGPFKTLGAEAREWQQGMYEKWEQAGCKLEQRFVDLAIKFIDELVDSQGEQVLTHQDLHGGNVLSSDQQQWLAIDPKPLIAEREFAIAPIVRSFELGHSREQVLARLHRLCKELELDVERARKWTIAQTVAWNLDGGTYPQHLETVTWLIDSETA